MLSTQDIAELEQKYKKYVLKKRVKYIFYILLLSVVFLAVIYFVYLNNLRSKKESTPKHIIKKTKHIKNSVIKKEEKKVLLSKSLLSATKDYNKSESTVKKDIKDILSNEKNTSKPVKADIKDSVKTLIQITDTKDTKEIKSEKSDTTLSFHIKPSTDFSYQEFSKQTLKLNLVTNTDTNISKHSENIVEKPTVSKKEKKKKEKRKVSNSTIKIEMNDMNSVKYLKEKYNKTHNIIFALMLCEEYYSLKKYKESLKWSIIANDLDNQSERSWIWFAKSKYRLNQKDDAIRALKAYLKTNESDTIRFLLEKIQNGELDD